MENGTIIHTGSNRYLVELENDHVYSCQARGKFKQDLLVAGDQVTIEILDEEKQEGCIVRIRRKKDIFEKTKNGEPNPDYLCCFYETTKARLYPIR